MRIHLFGMIFLYASHLIPLTMPPSPNLDMSSKGMNGSWRPHVFLLLLRRRVVRKRLWTFHLLHLLLLHLWLLVLVLHLPHSIMPVPSRAFPSASTLSRLMFSSWKWTIKRIMRKLTGDMHTFTGDFHTYQEEQHRRLRELLAHRPICSSTYGLSFHHHCNNCFYVVLVCFFFNCKPCSRLVCSGCFQLCYTHFDL